MTDAASPLPGGQNAGSASLERSRAGAPEASLVVEALSVRYGGVTALDEVSLSVKRGELVTVIGANGAGKSSLLNAVVGVVPKAGGRVLLEGDDVSRETPEGLVGRGVVLVPERRELFAAMSVEDNLRLGAYARYMRGDRDLASGLASVYETFPQLAERKRQLAGTMSGGEQQMLAIGRALMAKPRLLLLDEPSLGLAPLIVDEIFRVVGGIRDAGATVLLIEQNARAALALADHAYLLETGTVLLGAPADELARDERVASAYLGLGGSRGTTSGE
ncbi:MAG TPA: ABC transporter ATP-binding protein [Trueperaceae bacterium]|nr:ABC transporter ATP-binding protein [Trueperaceae bacterium]